MNKEKVLESINNTSVLQRKSDQVFSEIDGEIVMLSIENGEYYNLNSVGSEIWRLLDKPMSFRDLIDDLRVIYDVPFDICEKDVTSYLNDLVILGVIILLK